MLCNSLTNTALCYFMFSIHCIWVWTVERHSSSQFLRLVHIRDQTDLSLSPHMSKRPCRISYFFYCGFIVDSKDSTTIEWEKYEHQSAQRIQYDTPRHMKRDTFLYSSICTYLLPSKGSIVMWAYDVSMVTQSILRYFEKSQTRLNCCKKIILLCEVTCSSTISYWKFEKNTNSSLTQSATLDITNIQVTLWINVLSKGSNLIWGRWTASLCPMIIICMEKSLYRSNLGKYFHTVEYISSYLPACLLYLNAISYHLKT